MSSSAPILVDPPDWAGLSNDQLTTFVESVHALLDYGIFRPPLAAELVQYRDAASEEISSRIAGKSRERQAAARNTGTHRSDYPR